MEVEMKHQQALFEMATESGAELTFMVLEDQRCAILRDGVPVESYDADDASVGRALRMYFKLIEQCGGARHPFQALEQCAGHPHAG
jgi:hypothetical protein